jgi:hypothetical protein
VLLVSGFVFVGLLPGCWSTDFVPSKAELEDRAWEKNATLANPTPEIGLEWVTLQEAQERMPFRILQPSYLPAGVTLSGVRATKAGESIQAVRLVYSNGLNVIQSPQACVAVDGLQEVLRTSPRDTLDVNGATAVGHETLPRGYEGGRPDPVLADLAWGCDGGGCRVTGDMPLEELLRIAQSMR